MTKYHRVKRMEGLLSLIRFIKQRSENFLEPLSQIYLLFYDQELDECGFLSDLSQNGLDFAFEKNKALFGFDDFTSTSIEVFSISLGKMPLKEHITSCEYLLGEIGQVVTEEKNKLPKDKKLWCGIGALAGIFVIILML